MKVCPLFSLLVARIFILVIFGTKIEDRFWWRLLLLFAVRFWRNCGVDDSTESDGADTGVGAGTGAEDPSVVLLLVLKINNVGNLLFL